MIYIQNKYKMMPKSITRTYSRYSRDAFSLLGGLIRAARKERKLTAQEKSCLATAHNFLLSEAKARAIFEKLITAIEQNWDSVCKEAELNEVDKKLLWRRQFLNPFSSVVS